MKRQDVSVGENPVVTMDVEDGTIKFAWRTSLVEKTLDYDIDRCVGCSLCLPCPWEAITLGPVQEKASGRIEGAPLVNVDPNLCTFCGLCDSACVFHAFKASFEGEDTINEFKRIDGVHSVDDEKCAPCLLCMKVCPTGALEAEVAVDHKKRLVTYKKDEWAKGTISIDEEKCSQCGLCEILCPEAITIFWSDDVKPPDFRPAISIRVDENECDYCGLCAKICPDEAITVECTESAPRKIVDPKISGELKHDDDKCVKCGLCERVCPYEAITVEKPLEGEVIIKNLPKCDPTGCNNCFNICAVKAIYPTGTADKIAVDNEQCIYCGACEHSCPYDVLEVKRSGYKLEQLEAEREWERGRRLFFEAVVGRDPPQSGLYEREIEVKVPERVVILARESKKWESIDGLRERAMQVAQGLKDTLSKNPRIQLQIERGQTEKAIEQLKKSSKDQ